VSALEKKTRTKKVVTLPPHTSSGPPPDLGSVELSKGVSAMIEGTSKLTYGFLQLGISNPDEFFSKFDLPFKSLATAVSLAEVLESLVIKSSGTTVKVQLDIAPDKLIEIWEWLKSLAGV